MATIIRIGTRSSPLALIQTNEVKLRIINTCRLNPEDIEIVSIQTTGDIKSDVSLHEIGGKGLFTKELEEALLSGSIDLAVHSMKDVPAVLHKKLQITAILPREDPRDAIISNKFSTIAQLPLGAIIGTSSPRRAALMLNKRSDFRIVPFRGNVETRISKIIRGDVDISLLAVAGLKRLKIDTVNYHIIDTEDLLPAPAQGAIGVQTHVDNKKINSLIQKINHLESSICVAAERSFLAELGANCNVPIAALAKIEGEMILFKALIASLNGQEIKHLTLKGNVQDAVLIGKNAATHLSKNKMLNEY